MGEAERRREEEMAAAVRAGAGRGRGLTLPAWMTVPGYAFQPGLQSLEDPTPSSAATEPDHRRSGTGANTIPLGELASEDGHEAALPPEKRRRTKDRFDAQ